MIDTNTDLLIFLLLLLSALTFLRSLLLTRKIRKYKNKLLEATISLEQLNKEIELHQQEAPAFDKALDQVELTTKLQRSRLMISNASDDCNPPERYQYIHSMAQKGMTSGDISSILSISSQEADQLVKLANLAQR